MKNQPDNSDTEQAGEVIHSGAPRGQAERSPSDAEAFGEGAISTSRATMWSTRRMASARSSGSRRGDRRHKLELIHITFEENRMTLRVPVAKARSAGLRKLATASCSTRRWRC